MTDNLEQIAREALAAAYSCGLVEVPSMMRMKGAEPALLAIQSAILAERERLCSLLEDHEPLLANWLRQISYPQSLHIHNQMSDNRV